MRKWAYRVKQLKSLFTKFQRPTGQTVASYIQKTRGYLQRPFRESNRFHPARATTIWFKQHLDKARKAAAKMSINNVAFTVSSIEKAEIGEIDFAVSCLAFHHVANKELVISKIYQALAEKGKLVIGDWFRPCEKYREKVERLRSRNPQRAKEFDRSWQQALQAMSKDYGKKHPVEHPICPHKLEEIMRDNGFKKQRTVKSPISTFAVVIGEK